MENNYEAYEYAVLILKQLKGELSVTEEIKLNAWLKESPENMHLLEKLQDERLVQTDLDFFSAIDQKDAWQNIVLRGQKTSFANQVYLLIQKWKYAAVLLMALAAGGVWYKLKPITVLNPQTAVTKKSRFKNDVPPGSEKAKLILADGSVMNVNGQSSGMVKTYGNLKIISEHGLLTYKSVAGIQQVSNHQFNTITTPKGGKYKVELPDGSLVWLNSESSLKFPVAFSKHERRVYLTGEGYFEVAKDKHKPFKVFANNSIVQVLGTHFNVEAYKNEGAEKTTLLEGSVKIFNKQHSKLIVPGQQASIMANSKNIRINTIDVKEIVAWKDDLFVFDSEGIESVMREVARWYNVDVEYKDPIPQIHFSGSISRSNNISQILNMLELTGGVHFSIDGRKVTVTK
ncbi:MAG: FecR domain-containing protein [Mucilaginibacter sp.]|uniref:FecR family protein n=1 Tax=Mucilaginibacter sp. TaxID=1882438 RepID=UPI0032672959